jgi:hypothetical protein
VSFLIAEILAILILFYKPSGVFTKMLINASFKHRVSDQFVALSF